IGNQLWMSENLKSTHYRNGDALQIITSDLVQTTGAYSNNVHLGMGWEFYGNYYNWYAVSDSRNICPPGWHIPTKADWETLIENYAGENENFKFIVENYAYDDMVKGSTNESGLSALPMGTCIRVQTSTAPSFSMGVTMGDVSIWSATETDGDNGSAFYIPVPQGQLSPAVVKLNKRSGCAVRCVKD
ncbi:MAG TPA: fibrobacter succinogenes major paralogous domain-containing protein, partial [Bacteroidales bacterium]|nr:fibrobacter succinogenes major paralogous domain-containing protein [Bacteroidales bacterium]